MFKRKQPPAPAAFEQANAAACRRAADLARAEGDDTHAMKLECEAQAWESKAVEAVRRDRERRCGVYDTTF